VGGTSVKAPSFGTKILSSKQADEEVYQSLPNADQLLDSAQQLAPNVLKDACLMHTALPFIPCH
jgi:hypothetical protein